MIDLEQNREKAVLITVDTGVEDCDALLDELSELAKTAGADTVGRVVQKMDCPDSATFVGTGKLEEIRNFANYAEADLLIFDSELSPSQQRNIEKITDIRTIDRTLLILDIFGSGPIPAKEEYRSSLQGINICCPAFRDRVKIFPARAVSE